MHVFKRGEAPRRYRFATHHRTNDMIVVGKKGYSVFATRAFGRRFGGGTHGFLNCDKQMSAIFVATGNMFKQNYTKQKIKNVDVYNLMAYILRITPAKNDGNFSRVQSLLKKK